MLWTLVPYSSEHPSLATARTHTLRCLSLPLSLSHSLPLSLYPPLSTLYLSLYPPSLYTLSLSLSTLSLSLSTPPPLSLPPPPLSLPLSHSLSALPLFSLSLSLYPPLFLSLSLSLSLYLSDSFYLSFSLSLSLTHSLSLSLSLSHSLSRSLSFYFPLPFPAVSHFSFSSHKSYLSHLPSHLSFTFSHVLVCFRSAPVAFALKNVSVLFFVLLDWEQACTASSAGKNHPHHVCTMQMCFIIVSYKRLLHAYMYNVCISGCVFLKLV